MKATNHIILMATVGLVSFSMAEENYQAFFAQTNHTPIPLLEIRARYEYGNQENKSDSNAATIRARVGLQSQDYNGFSGLIEFEATRTADTQSYNSGISGDSNKTAIADPESTELNRLQLQYKKDDHLAIFGRQRIILNNARFVGNVGWRQNEQTYDAVYYKNTMIENLAIEYAYLDNVHRIFGSDAAYNTQKWESDSHLINASYTGLKGHTFKAYAYLLDFENAAANSSDTLGANYEFKGALSDNYNVTAYAEFAYQQDAANNPLDYDAIYLHLMASVAREGWNGVLGYELLGSDSSNTGSFKTPLATGHKFSGWNDQFLSTPEDGLNDFYVGIGIPVPKVPMKLIYHHFWADNGSATYGNEIDYLAIRKINPKTTAIAKASYFIACNGNKGNSGDSDRFRFSVELNYKY